ncbi:MAG: EscU/YscU/HrcU family type III secretion system export apparatus switch protein, partial [Alphaproteobacteria bacterium]
LIAMVGAMVVVPEFDRITQIPSYHPTELGDFIWTLAVRMIIAVLAVMTVVAGADMFFQKYKYAKEQRMTKQEVKDEHKQSEGDPMVKSRLRQIRMERARQRMMAAVPEATVVITNPTHFAVALKYQHDEMPVPVVIAKGVDDVALRIRKVADEQDIPIVENPPLAQALYAGVEIDQEVPPDHYKAVAEVIGYVMRLKGQLTN